MGFRIYIPRYSGESCKQYLLERGYEVAERNDAVCDPEELKLCDGMLVRAVPKIDDAVLAASPKLRVIGRYGAGYDNVDVAACTRRGVRLTFTPFANYVSVAEHTMMMLLQCAKNVGRVNEQFLGEHNYGVRDTDSGHDVEGRTLGLIGMGRVGRRVARLAQAFDMKVVGYDPFVPSGMTPEGIEAKATRDEVLAQADFVSLHLPGMPETYHTIDLTAMRKMKPTAYLLNSARGSVVSQDDLVAALNEGAIAGAAIDVYEKEPPAPDNPLLHMANVIASPHIAGSTKEALARIGLHAAMGIDDVLSGREPKWPVN